MTTTYIYWCNVVTTNKAVGNALAAAIDNGTGGHKTFDNAPECYPLGTTFTDGQNGPFAVKIPSQPATAWAVGVSMTQRGADMVAEFNTAGPYPMLNAAGVTDQQIAVAKQYVTAEVGPRAEYEARWGEFIQQNGYVIP